MEWLDARWNQYTDEAQDAEVIRGYGPNLLVELSRKVSEVVNWARNKEIAITQMKPSATEINIRMSWTTHDYQHGSRLLELWIDADRLNARWGHGTRQYTLRANSGTSVQVLNGDAVITLDDLVREVMDPLLFGPGSPWEVKETETEAFI